MTALITTNGAALTLMYWRACRALRAWPAAPDMRPFRLRCHDSPMMPTKAVNTLRTLAHYDGEGRLSEVATNTLAALLIEKQGRTQDEPPRIP